MRDGAGSGKVRRPGCACGSPAKDGRPFADRIKAAGHSFRAATENIAMGYPSAQAVVQGSRPAAVPQAGIGASRSARADQWGSGQPVHDCQVAGLAAVLVFWNL